MAATGTGGVSSFSTAWLPAEADEELLPFLSPPAEDVRLLPARIGEIRCDAPPPGAPRAEASEGGGVGSIARRERLDSGHVFRTERPYP